MNDADIIKSLKQCAAGGSCRHCPLEEEVGCRQKAIAYALDLIKRQKEEIERMEKEISRLKLEMSYMSKPNTIGDSHEMGCW